MPKILSLSTTNPAARGLRRLMARAQLWWSRQSPARQDRLATVGPLISVSLFLAAIALAFFTLRNEEIEREADMVARDTELTQQQMALRLIENQEQLARLARELVTRETSPNEFEQQTLQMVRDRSEFVHLSWVNAQRNLVATQRGQVRVVPASQDTLSWLGPARPGKPKSPSEQAFEEARERGQPVFSRAFPDALGRLVFQVHVPLIQRGQFSGSLIAEYAIETLLWQMVPSEVSRRHRISAVVDTEPSDNSDSRPLEATVHVPGSDITRERPSIVHEVPLTPALNGILVRGEGWRISSGFISNSLFWMVVALSVLTLWMLVGTWRHVARRSEIQKALLKETQFRRAMENSMLTGMRALDMEGRITYVNAAFCQMSGFSESDLLGCLPPYPFWPRDRVEENLRLLQQEMQGRSPPGGIEVKLMRKDGSYFDARMYVSPLIDPRGLQTGWMTSVTNITEAKRVRDQLSASHERFTTVLEGLDASVSVISVQDDDLLFANRSYRQWFGSDHMAHHQLTRSVSAVHFEHHDDTEAEEALDVTRSLPPVTEAAPAVAGELLEIYMPVQQKWFEVRSRYLQWTDGRLAQMVIATDITSRMRAEEQSRLQAEKAAVTSRLMTMGEMASSVAHELNQPLTAINNYCNGMVSRLQAGSINSEDLITALKKTAHQAQRAGQIIHRIRNFVKRSEPQRQATQARQIVDNTVELAGIELKRRNVAIRTYVAQRLPELMVDPILIEQVLINLLKNAAEAIDNAQMPPSRRHLELRVVPKHSPDIGGCVEFSVSDAGPGLPEEVLVRMFEAFFSTKAEGLGIGLSLCRSIVESHQGRLRAENLYNSGAVVGCRFSFVIPVDAATLHAKPAASDAPVSLFKPTEQPLPEPSKLPTP